ncbi:hypothetical protein BpHYR1_019915 [Brachionus plicatilis]|uniref:Uncharacterized protein n=1 Tax=Brachionus plicatilis TaxID=10195 RepID=A0A3M7PSU2_BRAPC|nr:hypothetical protein BpHYR1_019915 [Brachionus plicatilis]
MTKCILIIYILKINFFKIQLLELTKIVISYQHNIINLNKISETVALKQRFVFEYKIDAEKCKSKVQIRMRINYPKNVSEKSEETINEEN